MAKSLKINRNFAINLNISCKNVVYGRYESNYNIWLYVKYSGQINLNFSHKNKIISHMDSLITPQRLNFYLYKAPPYSGGRTLVLHFVLWNNTNTAHKF